MPPTNREAIFETALSDLNEGPQLSIMRLRQMSRILDDDYETNLWPLITVNAVTCLEWYARSILKQLIDYSADRINPEARILRELRINYALILQANVKRFTIGDIVATSRNFSSFDDIDATLSDLIKESQPSLLARVKIPLEELIRAAFRGKSLSKKVMTQELNAMFRKRHELVHGTPRNLTYRNELEAYVTKKELRKFIYYALAYIQLMESALRKFVPEWAARSTHDNNMNQYGRLSNSDIEIGKLESAIESRIAGNQLSEFRKAQRAWRLWRDRESYFQSSDWEGGTGRTAVLMGYQTSFNMERLRSLEAYVRQLDRQDY